MTADPLFYEIFKEIPELFFELIGQSGKETSIYKFSVTEIKQRGFRLDGLLSTPEAYPNEPIYFIEAQSYKIDNQLDQLKTLPTKACILQGLDFRTCVYTVAPLAGRG